MTTLKFYYKEMSSFNLSMVCRSIHCHDYSDDWVAVGAVSYGKNFT